MGLRLITAPTVEPVTLAQLKSDLRIDHSDDDTLLEGYISEAREFLERRLQFKIAEQTLELVIDAFPTDEVLLPVGPAISIVSVKYDDENGDEQTQIADDYYLDNAGSWPWKPWLFPTVGWPTTFDAINAVRIQYVAGMVPADVPGPVRAALRLKVQELYDATNRSGAIDNLLTNYYSIAI